MDRLDEDLRLAREELIVAIDDDDISRTKSLWRHFDTSGIDPFELELSVDSDEMEFDGHPCDWALERGAWTVLAHLLRTGLRRSHPNAEEIFGAIANGIDSYPESPGLVKCWTRTMQDVVRPSTLRQAHMLLNDTRQWELGPIAKAAWTEVAEKFIADHEKVELSAVAGHPVSGQARRTGAARL
ncbi:MAG: hypothetical protein V4508_08785 [Pseudomonadota bacterium]